MANVRKSYDAGVKVGEYQDGYGNTKGRWENVGAVFKDETRSDATPFLTLKKTFSPAGVPSNGDSIIISFFKPKSKDNNSQPVNNNSGYNGPAQNWNAKDTPDYSGNSNSDIPF